MSLKHVWIVFKKEVKDISRDRRTLLTNLLIPIILMPLLFTFLGGSMKKMEKDITENITVALTRESDTEEIRNLLENEVFKNYPNIKLNGSVDNPAEAIQNDKFRFVIDVEKDFSSRLEQGIPYTITIHYDQSDTKSSGSFGILAEAIRSYSQKTVKNRLIEMNIDPQILEPVTIQQVNAAKDNASGNFMIMMMLPMMASILIAVGGIPAATDLVAGEKERGTFEPLLTTQAGRMSVLFGKYLTVTLFSFVSVIAQLIGVVIGGMINPTFFTMVEGGSGELSFSIPTGALLLSILTIITLGMVFSAVQLAISTYARSFKEAQTYLSFLIFAAMIPSYATMMMQPDDLQLYMFIVPLLNAIASLKMILGSVINYTYLGIGLGTSLIYVILSLMFAAWMFNKEKYLFRN
ncbi:MAG TPA: ABC transporter permease [Clostridiales bacterium]|nr:ABC transporter permease [Clostridiales bacterium]